MTFFYYEPQAGSIEDLFEQAAGMPAKKKPEPRFKAEPDSTHASRPKGMTIDRSGTEYQIALANAERGLPPFREITFLEAIFFDNGEQRSRGVPRHQIKIGWTQAPPAVLEQATRSKRLTHRYIPLAVREQARDNWNRKGRQQGAFSFHADERAVLTSLMEAMRDYDAKRVDGQPRALIGCLQHRFGVEGTIRHSMFGLVLWRSVAEGWLPILVLVRSYTGEMLETRDRLSGEKRDAILMQPGRGDGVLAYGAHYGDNFLVHIEAPYLDDLAAANLRASA
jgi:hypothetical protein